MHKKWLSIAVFTVLLSACGGGSSVKMAPEQRGPAITKHCVGQSFREEMVCAHNALRKTPPAGQKTPEPPLRPMKWNQKLADYARAYAGKCSYEHSDGEASTDAFGEWVGENLAAGTAGSYDDATIVGLWADEAANFDYSANSCAPGKVCGHYTQILWRDTVEVGCAKVTCGTLANQEKMKKADFWVCSYLPGGNIVGDRPY